MIGLATRLVSVGLTVWTSGSAGVAVAGRLLGLPDSLGAQALAYALVAAVSAAVAIWGYRWLVRTTAIIFSLGGTLLPLMPFAFAGSIDWGYAGGEYLLGTFWATWLLVAVAVGVAGALVVCTIVGDWSRYISADRHPARSLAPVAAALFLGFAVPAAIGAIVSTAFTDPFAPFPVSLAGESPLWAAGSVAGLLTMQTPLFSGPLAGIAAGVDISLLLGAVVAAVVYLPFAARGQARTGEGVS